MQAPFQPVLADNEADTAKSKKEIVGDEFLNLEDMLAFRRAAAERHLKETLMEMDELIRDKNGRKRSHCFTRWQKNSLS